ncbi:MAG: histidine triad nucleotide-binding protein [Gammaproteobacteria bacterium]|nr:histidine triad nucleotide-binding protein [Gammaproteobacteria bacterium]
MDCLFCGIIDRKIPAEIVLETDELLAFRDVNPQAPTHILVIPKKHIQTINHATPDDEAVLGKLILAAKAIAAQEDLKDFGYRLVFNTNEHGGQTVYHIHSHLLGGRQMTWPPG